MTPDFTRHYHFRHISSARLARAFSFRGLNIAGNTTAVAEKKPPWIDTTINVQTLLGSLIGGGIALSVAYFGFVGRVASLEQKGGEHERRLQRVEPDIWQTRDDTSQQMRNISADVKEQLGGVSNDVKDIRRYLMDTPPARGPTSNGGRDDEIPGRLTVGDQAVVVGLVGGY